MSLRDAFVQATIQRQAVTQNCHLGGHPLCDVPPRSDDPKAQSSDLLAGQSLDVDAHAQRQAWEPARIDYTSAVQPRGQLPVLKRYVLTGPPHSDAMLFVRGAVQSQEVDLRGTLQIVHFSPMCYL